MVQEHTTLIITVVSLVGNGYFLLRLNGIKSYDELVKFWKNECEKKDYQLKEKEEKQKKAQEIIKKLNRKLHTYEQYHNHLK